VPLAVPQSRTHSPVSVPAVVGSRLTVPLVTGERVGYANLDHAASAPCLAPVRDAVDELLPWYASVHRGAGFASRVSTQVYEQARETVRTFLGARHGDAVVFTRNTTDALNLLARALPRHTSVVLFDTEHHAALLPWRGPHVRRIATPNSPAAAVRALEDALAGCPVGPRLVVLTGASNVTGELWPVESLAEVARRHAARVALDAAQLAPHRRIRLRELDVDYVALSGHKLYAPFGAGVLVGRPDWLRAANPYLAGGGATSSVLDHGDHLGVVWTEGPERHEAGSPNVVGVHALATACATIDGHGWPPIVEHETTLLRRLRSGLAGVPGLRELSLFSPDPAHRPDPAGQPAGGQAVRRADDHAGPERDRVGVVSFTVEGHDPGLLAAALSAEYGIGVRDGAFCAHVAVRRLLRSAGSTQQRALRASLGLGSTVEHVDRLVRALGELVTEGPRWTYRQHEGRWVPEPDPRVLPPFLTG
jgi:selenocysteine lyase/cysteine desulfurase